MPSAPTDSDEEGRFGNQLGRYEVSESAKIYQDVRRNEADDLVTADGCGGYTLDRTEVGEVNKGDEVEILEIRLGQWDSSSDGVSNHEFGRIASPARGWILLDKASDHNDGDEVKEEEVAEVSLSTEKVRPNFSKRRSYVEEDPESDHSSKTIQRTPSNVSRDPKPYKKKSSFIEADSPRLPEPSPAWEADSSRLPAPLPEMESRISDATKPENKVPLLTVPSSDVIMDSTEGEGEDEEGSVINGSAVNSSATTATSNERPQFQKKASFKTKLKSPTSSPRRWGAGRTHEQLSQEVVDAEQAEPMSGALPAVATNGDERMPSLLAVAEDMSAETIMSPGCISSISSIQQSSPIPKNMANFADVQEWYRQESIKSVKSAKYGGDIVAKLSTSGNAKMGPRQSSKCSHIQSLRVEMTSLSRELETCAEKLRRRVKDHTLGGRRDLVDALCRECTEGAEDAEYGVLNVEEFKIVIRVHLKFTRSEISDSMVQMLFEFIDDDDQGVITMQQVMQFAIGAEYYDEGNWREPSPSSPRLEVLHEEEDPNDETQQWKNKKGKVCLASRSRLESMYAEYGRKLETLAQKRQDQEMTVRKETAKKLNRKPRPENFNPEASGERLYQYAVDQDRRRQQRQRMFDAAAEQAIETEKERAFPTRRRQLADSDTELNPGVRAQRAVQRLHMDGARREQDRQEILNALAMAEEHAINSSPLFGSPGKKGTTRHLKLYTDAARKDERMEQKREEGNERIDAQIRSCSVPCGDRINPDRIYNLHNEHAERNKRQRAAYIAKQEAEEQAIQKYRDEVHARIGSRRPSACDNPLSPRFVQTHSMEQFNDSIKLKAEMDKKVARENWVTGLASSTEGKQRMLELWKSKMGSEEERNMNLSLKNHADQVLQAITKTISLRNPFVDMSGLGEQENARPQLVESLKSVMDLYREAKADCETGLGFHSLCNRASMRLFNEKLIPDFEGWSSCRVASPVFQVEDDLADLLRTAKEAHRLLKLRISSGSHWEGEISKPTGMLGAEYVSDPGLKTEESAKAKALILYGPAAGKLCHRHLLDFSRLLVVFSSCAALNKGLDWILENFEVVGVNNYFNKPVRLGMRYIEVFVIVHVPDGDEQIPHICELRLEERVYNEHQKEAAEIIYKVYDQLRLLLEVFNLNWSLTEYLIKSVLNGSGMSPELRRFRCHFIKRYGSTPSGWRKEVGERMADFGKFKVACQKINWGHRASEFYQELDTSLGGCVNVFHLDPEPVALLIKLRSRLFTFADLPILQKATTNKFGIEPAALFDRLTSHIRLGKKGECSLSEFRLLGKPLTMSDDEMDKAFKYIDGGFGGSDATKASISVADIAWIMKLPKIVDEHAVTLNADIADIEQRKMMVERSLSAGPHGGRLKQRAEPQLTGASADENGGDEGASPLQSPRVVSDDSTPVKIRAGPWKQKKRRLRNSPPGSPRSPSPRSMSPPRVGPPQSILTRRESDFHQCMCGHIILADANFCQGCGAKRLDPETEPPPNERCDCGAVFPTDALFCQRCGSKRPRTEDSERTGTTNDCNTCTCGSVIPRDARFCPNCGQTVSEAILKTGSDFGKSDTLKSQRSEPLQTPTRSVQRIETESTLGKVKSIRRNESKGSIGKVVSITTSAKRQGSERSTSAQSADELSADAHAGAQRQAAVVKKVSERSVQGTQSLQEVQEPEAEEAYHQNDEFDESEEHVEETW
jgi:hypothetical protein